MLDGVLMLAAPPVLLYIAFRAWKGMRLRVALLWTVVAVYGLWAADLLFFPVLIDPALRTHAAHEARHLAFWVNLVPLATIRAQLMAPTGIQFRQLGGNIGLLFPLGLIGPALVPRLRTWPRILRAALACSLGFELLQLAGTLAGIMQRSVDIDDILLNVIGAILGFALWKMMSRAMQAQETEATEAA